MNKKLLFTLLIICPGLLVKGQDSIPHGLAFEANIHRGFLVAHRPMIIPLQQDHVTGLEASIIIHPDGSKEWHRIYGFPEIGLAFTAWDLGNPKQLGAGVSLIPYVDFPLVRGKKSKFDLKFGWGIGYIEKTFDAEENYKNIAIGSHLNCALLLQPRFKTQITERITFNCGLSFSHFSNGSVATPNLGLNLAALTGGLSYKFGNSHLLIKDPLTPFVKSSRITLFGAVSMKQVYPADGKNYFACSLSGGKDWQISRKSTFGFGGDIFYDNSIVQKLEERDMEMNSSLEAFKLGIHGGYELAISDLSVVIHMGVYVYSKLSNDGTFYQRVGLRYRINQKIFALFQLKAHWGKADYIECGIGYRLDKFKSK